MVIGTILLSDLAHKWSYDGLHTNGECTTIRVFADIGIAICIAYSFLLLVMRERINLAVGVIKTAARAMDSMHGIVFLPAIQAAGLAAFLVLWVIYCFFLASSGDIEIHQASYTYQGVTTSYNYRTFSYKPSVRYAFIFFVFALFWTSEFILAIGQLVIALCFAAWYFTRDKSTIHSRIVLWVSRIVSLL
jgi:hypothetical protein